jgi:two-component system, OmpR family, KDP operon response regulator KdpE
MTHIGGTNIGAKILVIDDDPDIAKLLFVMLKPLGFTVHHACNGREGLRVAYELQPDLVILDVIMPLLDGWDACARLRELSDVPILMLSSCTSETDLLRGFTLGADDYVRKPFSKAELEARVQALLRRRQSLRGNGSAGISHYKDNFLNIDLETQVVERDGNLLDLSSTEYSLLSCLVRNLGKTVTHNQLLHDVWGCEYGNLSSSLTLYIYYLRKKLEDPLGGHKYIHTQWGRGYCFMPVNGFRNSN